MIRDVKITVPSGAYKGRSYTWHQEYYPYKGYLPVRILRNEKGEVVHDGYNVTRPEVEEYLAKKYTYAAIKDGEVCYIKDFTKYINGNFAGGRNLPDYIKWLSDPTTPETKEESYTMLPQPFVVNAEEGDAVRLTSAAGSYTYPSKGRMTLIYNLVPQTDYVCEVIKDGEAVTRETFRTKGTMRMVCIGEHGTIRNARDLGGKTCYDEDGNAIGRIAYGRIFRGRCLDSADAAALETLTGELGVSVVLDTRATKNVPVKGVEYLPGKTYGWSDSSIYKQVGTNTTVHSKIKLCIEAIVTRLEQGKNIYTHCEYGQDRTGVLCFIIEMLCGCMLSDGIQDWEISSLSYTYPGRYISSSSQMRYFLNFLYETYGGSEGKTFSTMMREWAINTLGISEDIIDRLRAALVA